MSGIISYVKRIGVWLCIVIACEMIMIITMMLNKIPFAEIGYGIFISLFLLLILLVEMLTLVQILLVLVILILILAMVLILLALTMEILLYLTIHKQT